jgi:hypothetical protein
LGAIEHAVELRAVTLLADELLHRLEEVHVQPGQAIDVRELGIGGLRGEAIIANELAHAAPFFCSTWALSFFFHGRLRVKTTPVF